MWLWGALSTSVHSKDNKQALESVDFFCSFVSKFSSTPSLDCTLNPSRCLKLQGINSLDVVAQYGKAAGINLQ